MTNAFRIFISDPHTIFREGIKKIISANPGLIIAGESDNVHELSESLKKARPDLLLIYTLPFKASIEVAESIINEFPDLKIVLLTNITKHPELYTAYSKGVAGIIHKAIGEEELLTAFEEIRKGFPYYSQEILPYLLKRQPSRSDTSLHKREDWTEREIAVLKYICKGYNNSEISELLNLKSRSVEGHKSRMIEKACVPNTINLVLYALKNKLISISDL
jgi:DNA-binding NarL/FixJ family response regulator